MMVKVVYVTFFDQINDKDIIMPYLAKTDKVIGFSSRVIIKYKYFSRKEAYVYEIKEEENQDYPYIEEIIDDFPLLENKKEDIEKAALYYFCSPLKILSRLLPFTKKEEEYRKIYYEAIYPTPLNKINKREYELLELIKKNKRVSKDDYLKSATIKSLLDKKYIKEVIEDEKAPSFIPYLSDRSEDDEKLISDILNCEEKNILVETDNNFKEYILAIDLANKVLSNGKSILIISPFVDKCDPMIEFLNLYFKDNFIVLSSSSNKEKIQALKKIKRQPNQVVYGDRYAVFAPIDDLELIIVFKEQNSSYKDEKLFLNYKDIALKSSKKVVLFSKSPSPSTKARQLRGYLRGFSFKSPNNKSYQLIKREEEILPNLLKDKIRLSLKNKGQVLIFHQTRGTSPFYKCDKCLKYATCPNCLNTLTYYEDEKKLVCLSCGYHISVEDYHCSNCGSHEFSPKGMGTMLIQKYLEKEFPESKVSRLDADSYKDKDYQLDFSAFATGDNDIIVGTKELADNFLLPKVDLIIVMDIDWILKSTSFNIEEKYYELTSSLLSASQEKSEAYIIAEDPSSYPLNIIAKQNYQEFYQYTLNKRRLMMAPPYYYFLAIRLFNQDKENLLGISDKVAKFLENQFKGRKVYLIGPYNVRYFKKQRGYKSLIMLKYRKREDIEDVINKFLSMRLPKGVGLEIDVDPEGE